MCDDYLTTLGLIFRDYNSPLGIAYFFMIGGFWGIDAQRFIYLPLIFKN